MAVLRSSLSKLNENSYKSIKRDSLGVSEIVSNQSDKENTAKNKKSKSLKVRKISTKKLKFLQQNQCEYCEETFDSQTVLKLHIGMHHPDKPTPDLQTCTICGKVVRYMRSHMDTHNGPSDRHACSKCGRRFAKRKYLVEHELTHVADREPAATCPICQRPFSKKSNLNAHLRLHEQHRDDTGSYLQLRRAPKHAANSAVTMTDIGCGLDPDVRLSCVAERSKSCDTSDLDQYCSTGRVV